VNSLCGQRTKNYFTENRMKVKTTENIDDWIQIFIFYLISRLNICFGMMSKICVRRHIFFTRRIFPFTLTENCVSKRVAASFIMRRISAFLSTFPLQEKYFTWPQNKNTNWGQVKGKTSLGVLRQKTDDIKHSYKYRLTCRLRWRAGLKVNILE